MIRVIADHSTLERLLDRSSGRKAMNLEPDDHVDSIVHQILSDVDSRGDTALLEYAGILDGNFLDRLEVESSQIAEAIGRLPGDTVNALELAAGRIADFHKHGLAIEWFDQQAGFGSLIRPIDRVGLYVPGGTASYPSTVLMTGIPAKIAGVPEVILCTPNTSDEVLASASLAGIDRVFMIGGAQAIAAMAYGTHSIPKVDKICGPGNAFVAAAKRAVYGMVDIDGIYGPTETMIIADESAPAPIIASDLLAQAEHDPMATPILLTTSEKLAEEVVGAVEQQLSNLERYDIAKAAIDANALVGIVGSVNTAIELANLYAPEHLCLAVEHAMNHVGSVRNAGGVFVGVSSPEVIGDYVAGPSHAMPTSGTARFSSNIGVSTFVKHVPVVELDVDTFKSIGPAAAKIARAEGLTAHAKAIERRLEGERF